MAKKNVQDATVKNVRASHKRDDLQNTRIERLEDAVTALTLRVEKLERDVNNPLGLRT